MGAATAFVRQLCALVVRMRGMVLRIRTILRTIVSVGVIPLGLAIVMVPERHALSGGDRGHALNRDGQGQQQDGNKAEESFRHLGSL